MSSVREADDRRSLDIAAALGLTVYSFVAALGFARVFGDWTFVGDVAAVAVVGHGVSLAARTLRLPGPASFVLTTLALAWIVAWVSYPETFGFVFPTRTTWNVAWADLDLVGDQFAEAVAPVAYLGGWSLLAALGTAAVVLLGDTLAFHARGRGEALVPGVVLFVFVAALGADRHRVALTLALVAAGFLAVALLRARFSRTPRTILGRAHHPLATTTSAAVLAGTIVVLGAWAIGPRLPGAEEEPWFETRVGGGGGVTEVLNPLVDIRARLVNQAPVELFTVQASSASYWRVSALPVFDGNTWDIGEQSVDDADGQLTAGSPGAIENRQSFVVTGLGGRLVPAAPDPVQAAGEGLRFNDDTSTLVRTDRALESGDRYEIVSAMPQFSPDALRAASSSGPPGAVYLELPEGFPSSVTATAQQVTAGATTSYDASRALQDWFRSTFTYSTEIPAGHSTSAIEGFLRQRVGYCEQFAGTFAAMARSLGIPARVAVGFTPGLVTADGTYSVLGKNAHAWPEVWFDGYGWVAFEPTPGRGAPGDEAYTGVAPAQDDVPVDPAAGGAAAPSPAEAPQRPLPLEDAGGIPDANQDAVATPVAAADPDDRGFPWLVVLALVAAAVVAAPALARRVRRRHLHR
ncbi:MAG: DUF3488 and transglutaminase-like domain-containing protein, partial [Actinomycetota bacterium]|nr:DUF3488 and transglutaminase-like domain-containing protein [Actinomycetota bacterium]